jgi:hypothetical protein
VREKKLSGRRFCGEAVTSGPRLHASGVLFSMGGYAVSCTASTMYTSETKARRMNISFGHDTHCEVSFSNVLLSETHMLITDLFGLLGKKQVRGGTTCKAVFVIALTAAACTPAWSLDARQAKNRDGNQ